MKKILLEKIKEEDVEKLSVTLFFSSLVENKAQERAQVGYHEEQKWMKADFYNSANFSKNRLPKNISQLLSSKFYLNLKNEK